MKNMKPTFLIIILALIFSCKESNSQSKEESKTKIEKNEINEKNLISDSDYKKYEKNSSSELGDLNKKMWSKVIEKEKGIPQGVYKTKMNYFIYVQRLKDRVRSFQKYTFDKNGTFITKENVELEEVKHLMDKFKRK